MNHFQENFAFSPLSPESDIPTETANDATSDVSSPSCRLPSRGSEADTSSEDAGGDGSEPLQSDDPNWDAPAPETAGKSWPFLLCMDIGCGIKFANKK